MTYQISKTMDQLREEYVAPDCAFLAFQSAESITNDDSNPFSDNPPEEDE